ncbi:2-aminoethylphosphonate ABC transporter substrate-binding protein [Acidimangrovimonas sediminis]|uniref:2-aminoethylphosphonate ABC transporter substrate-binding protein n=1 Tax=Acidimangrovimonas sediminis TaxID=2056283 RepID=UPI000C80C1D9|nr:2-aminoethylphosphonate ABC transporter substrate-binding protein [Acidimangrovimonas sediminis]
MNSSTLFGAAVLALLAGPALAADQVVTIYSADGLHDGHPNWFQTEFDAFTKKTGIKVQYVEGGSGVVVQRVAQEKANPQADVLVTLPPFMQKAAGAGLLQAYKSPEAAQIPASDKDPGNLFNPMVNNYMNFIYNTKVLAAAPKTWDDLLAANFKGKLQYSTPGQAGDGTAVMLEAVHAMGGADAGFGYLRKLQANNVGPSSSTGKLTALVNKGELYVANGDLQMNMAQTARNPNIRPFWPANAKGERSTFALPYYVALVKGAPHGENGKKLIDFLLSKAAQSKVSTIAYGLPVRADVKPTDAHYKTMHKLMQGVTVWHPDWDAVAKDLDANVARWQQATGN